MDETRFHVGEDQADRHPYTCSYHAFRAADGRVIVIDLVRSDDTGKRCLRVFVAGEAGGVRSLIIEAPSDSWAPFAATERPALDGKRNVLGRGDGWIAGRVDGAGPDIHHVAFELFVEPSAPGVGTGELSLTLLQMSVTDYPLVRTHGWIEIDAERIAIDTIGTVSIHFGRKLPQYLYLVTVSHGASDDAPALLAASARGDDLRFGGSLLGEHVVTYAHGRQGLPSRFVHVAPFSIAPVALGQGATIELSELRVIPHQLLDMATVAATALATYVGPAEGALPFAAPVRLPLGRVMIDARGEAYEALFRAADKG